MSKENIEGLRKVLVMSFLITSIYASFSDLNQAIYFLLLALFVKIRTQKQID